MFGGDSEVIIDDVAPNPGLTGVTLFGAEDGTGFIENWSVIANAICATPPAGLQLVTATSPTTSSSKGVTATCPTGKRVVGTGADLAGGLGQVVLDDIAPNAGLTAVTAFGVEDGNGTTNNWTIRAFAVCANPPAGLQRVAITSASSSDVDKSSTAPCPAGKDLLGLGGELTGGAGQVALNALNLLTGPPASVRVEASEDEDGQAANWSLTAYAICANGSQREVTEQAAPDSGTGYPAHCPSAKAPTGGGGDITGGLGRVLLTLSWTFGDPLTSWFAGANATQSAAAGWTLRSYAICATPLLGLERVSLISDVDNSSPKTVTVPCPAGKRVVGAGGTTNGQGQVMLDDVVPNAAVTAVTAAAIEDGDGYEGDWRLIAYAVCANPPPGLQRVSASRFVSSEDEFADVTATCPAGKNLLGTGAELGGGDGRVTIDDLRPNGLLTANTVAGIETDFGNPDDWSVTAYAICANP